MSHYSATIRWQRGSEEAFTDNKYSRGHTWEFDGGATVAASSSPEVVPLPYSVEANVDPEEAFIASLSSCHMLFFLSIAAKKKWCVDRYEDLAVGVMTSNDQGKTAVTKVTLKPLVTFSGEHQPSLEQLEKVHHLAHESCFIANSVTSEILIEIRMPT
ncbi:MAG: OsmC family protein [Reinekea sp.]|jgi:organic hydroperoxide reductase OsmC/OhrA